MTTSAVLEHQLVIKKKLKWKQRERVQEILQQTKFFRPDCVKELLASFWDTIH